MAWRKERRLAREAVSLLVASALLLGTAYSSETDAASNAAGSASGCQVCAATGDCSRAYLGMEGKYCGPWLDQLNHRQSCCCPTTASCKLENYSCRCSTMHMAASKHHSSGSSGWAGVVIGAAVLLSCCVGGCWCFFNATKRARRPLPEPQPVVIGQPVKYAMPSSVPIQAVALPPYNVAPAYPYPTAPGYDYGSGYYNGAGVHHHHHSNGIGVGVGAVAGLAAGMIMANAISDAGYDHHHDFGGGYDGGGGFDGGGGDFGGDF